MKLFCSNRLEELADALASVLRQPLPDPFQAEVIVVQSRGMARWLSQYLAGAHRICANYKFPFPKAFASEVFWATQPGLEQSSLFEPEVLQWRIMRLLPRFVRTAEFQPIRHYLEGDDEPLRLYQLGQKIAFTFDQYLVYRPEMVLEWESSRPANWQAILWNEVVSDINLPHAAQLQRQALKILSGRKVRLPNLPPRIAFFGISALPEFYVQLFAALGAHREVNFFGLQPTHQEWSGISSKREIARSVAKAGHRWTQEELHLEEGHPLLASWGTLGREFFQSLLQNAAFEGGDEELFVRNEDQSMLHRLQNGILELESHPETQALVSADDDSIQIHSCHTPIRELEVLYDHILDWFGRDPELKPRDIVVMMPDVETYTPFIQAVFDVPEDKKRRIPFSIADRSAKSESHIADTLLKILGLADSRFGARSVLAVLECQSVQQRFELTESDMASIASWVQSAGIRWGIDGNHRASFDLPALPAFSWLHGLERLLLGYAMAGRGENTFADLLPCDEIEGSAATALGKFVEFANALFALREELNRSRSLHEWNELLLRIVESFFHSNLESERELQLIRKNLGILSEQQKASGFEGEIGLSVIRSHLDGLLQNESFGSGFLNGGVTFCSLKPLRSLPFKIVCLVGMNDADFPRHHAAVGFDLMQQSPQPGDPSTRNDDQFLFLQALLSARQKLFISYVGQSVKDNKPVPPCVLVSELVDFLQGSFELPEHLAPQGGQFVTKHRLQAFSADYFSGGRLFTFSRSNASALLASQHRVEPAELIAEPLGEPEVEWRAVSLRQLTEFFFNPSRFFVQNRLRIKLSEMPESIEECEPFLVGGRDGYNVKQLLLEKELRSGGLGQGSGLAMKCSSVFPLGQVGESSHRDIVREVSAFAVGLKPRLPAEAPQTVCFENKVGPFDFSAELKVCSTGLLQYRCAKIKAADVLRAWICHLALNMARPPGIECGTLVVGTDEEWTFPALADSQVFLRELLDLYWLGLSQPLRFFPESSLAYAMAAAEGKGNPLNAAYREWVASSYSRGEEEDIWFRFCFRKGDPLSGDFADLGCKVFAPVLKVGRRDKRK